jgi:tetratricopeptide (TPR) repeat protein
MKLHLAVALTLAPLIACGSETPPLADSVQTTPGGASGSSAPEENPPADYPQDPARDPALEVADEAKLGDAFRQLGSGNFAGCRAIASEVLANSPTPATRARAEFVLGLGYHKAKQYADARTHFELAAAGAEFTDKHALPYYQAWCCFWLGDMDSAERFFELHLTQREEGDSHFGLGVIALERGLQEPAEKQLTKALELFEARVAAGNAVAARDVAKAHARLADVNLMAEDFEGAKQHLLLATQLDSNRSAVWYKLYQVAIELEDKALEVRGLSEYNRCLEQKEQQSGMASGGDA